MQFSFEKRKYQHIYWNYSIVFACVALFVYGTYLITGHALIWYIDAANQHLPLLQSYRKVLLNFIHHPTSGLPTWSWHMGLGSSSFQVYSYYVVGDIFDYLTLLVPASKVVLAYQILIVVRMYLAGLSFTYFATHFNFKKRVIIAGANIYIFNAFLLYANVAHPFFTVPFILFPLIITALERVLQNKNAWPLLGIFTWMLLNNFYFAFMLGIGALIYLILRVILTYRFTLNYKKTLFKLSWATITSLLLSSFLLVPEFIAVQDSTRSASTFANGLKIYPLYYYLALPSQLINGGNRDFYFWSALGFASIAFFALIYVFSNFRRYLMLNTVFILGFLMLLIPAFGALFNGGMSPSNRWSLMLCLPMALACCLLLEHATHLSIKTLKLFIFATIIYTFVLCIDYFFDSTEKLFVPIIFLFVTLGALIWFNFKPTAHSTSILTFIVICNVLLNAVYFEAPYDGGYSNEMLSSGSYQKISKKAYAGLNKDLTNTSQYRVSTISNNYYFGNGFNLYNSLNSNVHSINSYYSLQNNYLGNFMNEMGNTQYEATRPVGQVSDRTVLNNFLGVRYLFTQINQANSSKIPAGYTLDAMTRKITNVNHDTNKDSQTRRYTTKYAFPLVYWQSSTITTTQYNSLTSTQKERALATGVVVSKTATKNTHRVKNSALTNTVINVPYKIISSRGNVITTNKLVKEDSDEKYKIILLTTSTDKKTATKLAKLYANSELHVEITNIKYTPFTFSQQIALEKRNSTYDLTNGLLGNNSILSYYKYFRYHILKGSPDNSYSLSVSSSLGTEKITQPNQNATSFYKVVTGGTLNSGYFTKLPKQLTLTPSKLGTYSFKLKVVAEPLGKNSNYYKQVKRIQKHALQNVTYTNHGFSGKITTTKTGILTSSIPYSRGWSVTVDGKQATVLKTNNAFLGVKLAAGTHKVRFIYTTPGANLGIRLSIIGVTLVFISVLGTLIIKRRKD